MQICELNTTDTTVSFSLEECFTLVHHDITMQGLSGIEHVMCVVLTVISLGYSLVVAVLMKDSVSQLPWQ